MPEYKQNTTIRAEIRKMRKVGESFYLSLPPEFVKEHNLKPGDALPVAYNGVLIVTPIPEAKEPVETLELEYTQIIERKDRVLIPVGDKPVDSFLDRFDPLYEQLKAKYPDYMIKHIDTITVRISKRNYFQPTRIVLQRIRGIVPTIEK